MMPNCIIDGNTRLITKTLFVKISISVNSSLAGVKKKLRFQRIPRRTSQRDVKSVL